MLQIHEKYLFCLLGITHAFQTLLISSKKVVVNEGHLKVKVEQQAKGCVDNKHSASPKIRFHTSRPFYFFKLEHFRDDIIVVNIIKPACHFDRINCKIIKSV